MVFCHSKRSTCHYGSSEESHKLMIPQIIENPVSKFLNIAFYLKRKLVLFTQFLPALCCTFFVTLGSIHCKKGCRVNRGYFKKYVP